MANWIANAKAQASLPDVPIKAGEGQLVSEGPWQVVVELRSLDDRSVIVKYDKTNGQWAVGSGYAITRPHP